MICVLTKKYFFYKRAAVALLFLLKKVNI